MKAAIIYNSKHGKTAKYAESIQDYLKVKKIESTVSSIDNYSKKDIEDADVVFLGCWTSGLFLFLQGPEPKWVKFAKDLPDFSEKKVALFTTYLLATGSMFKNMKKNLSGAKIIGTLRSKKGEVCDVDKLTIDSITE
jgi:flavodoxin